LLKKKRRRNGARQVSTKERKSLRGGEIGERIKKICNNTIGRKILIKVEERDETTDVAGTIRVRDDCA